MLFAAVHESVPGTFLPSRNVCCAVDIGDERTSRGRADSVVPDPEPTLNWQFPINLYSWVHALRQHCGLICKHPFSPL